MRIASALARMPACHAPAPRRVVEPVEGELLLASESAHEAAPAERDRAEPIPLEVVVIRATRPEDISLPPQPATRGGLDTYEQVLGLGAVKTLGFSAIA